MKRIKTGKRSTSQRGTNVVHQLDLPALDRRRTRRRARLEPEPLVEIRPAPRPPAPEPAPVTLVPAPRPEPLHDSQARHQIQLLERRLLKMARLLEQRDLESLSGQAPVEDGVASIYRDVQGLDGGENQVEQKLELMTTIFEQNLKLRERVTSASSAAR